MREILLLCEYATLNGGERSMLATLDGVRAADFTPVVMAPPHGPLAEALAARNVELLPFDCRASDGSRLPQSRLREWLARAACVGAGRRCCTPTAWRWEGFRARWPQNLRLPSLSHLRDIVKLSARRSLT